MGKRITAEEFAERINILFDGKLDIIKDTFKGMRHKVSVRCNIHNCVFEAYAFDLSLNRTDCPECSREKFHRESIVPWKEMLKRFRDTYDDRFSYDETTYDGYKTKMKVVCNKCGTEFWIKPEHHLKYNNGGCPKCHLTVTMKCCICGTIFEVDRHCKGLKRLPCPKCRKILYYEIDRIYTNDKHKASEQDILDLISELANKNVLLLDLTHMNINIIDAINLYYENKISFELIKEHFPILIRTCVICKKEFVRKLTPLEFLSKSNTCSEECVKELRSKRSKEIIIKRKENGTFKGWTTRNIDSYAEKYWMRVLDNLNIKYIREYHFAKYFLDFKIEVGNIILDLEIDGHQHIYRVEHDKERDLFLTENGFTVYRIPWNNVSTKNGHLQMQDKIDKFLEFYNSLKEQLNIK